MQRAPNFSLTKQAGYPGFLLQTAHISADMATRFLHRSRRNGFENSHPLYPSSFNPRAMSSSTASRGAIPSKRMRYTASVIGIST